MHLLSFCGLLGKERLWQKLLAWSIIMLSYIQVTRSILGSMQDVDYEATMAAKLTLAQKIFAREKDSILNSSSFQKYLSENEV